MTKALVLWLVHSKQFEGRIDGVKRGDIFDETLDRMTWPSHIGRLASNIVQHLLNRGDGRQVKADEWSRIRAGLPLALWLSWRSESSDDIEDGNSNRRSIYRAVLDFVASLRTLLARSITINHARESQELLASACRSLVSLGMPMTINWHMGMHYAEAIELYGPAGGFAGWAFERNNGVLARANYFRGDPVQMTSTAARRWVKDQLLRSVLENPAPDSIQPERDYNQGLLARMDTKKIQGTLLVDEFRGNAANFQVRLLNPVRQALDLLEDKLRLYTGALDHVRRLCPQKTIKHLYHIDGPGLTLKSKGHEEYSSVLFNGYR